MQIIPQGNDRDYVEYALMSKDQSRRLVGKLKEELEKNNVSVVSYKIIEAEKDVIHDIFDENGCREAILKLAKEEQSE